MKKTKIAYWTLTLLFCLPMLLSATMYFINPEVKAHFAVMGFHDAFRIELGLAKYIGVVLLLAPIRFRPLKEWAYAGYGITLISAIILHISAGDPIFNTVFPGVFFLLLIASYICYDKLQRERGAGFAG